MRNHYSYYDSTSGAKLRNIEKKTNFYLSIFFEHENLNLFAWLVTFWLNTYLCLPGCLCKGKKRMVSVWHHLPDTYQTLTCRCRALARILPTAYRKPDEVTRRHGVTLTAILHFSQEIYNIYLHTYIFLVIFCIFDS